MATDNSSQESQFQDTPTGWAARLTRELEAARKALKPWHDQAEKAIKAYLDERDGMDQSETRWNIFTSDTQTQEAILFGNPPRASVTRRFADAGDDIARVAAEIQERLLNEDIESDAHAVTQAIEYANAERGVVGFGAARIRYVIGETVSEPGKEAMIDPATGQERAPAVPEVERRPDEQVETDWAHWRDVLWGPCRVWEETPWVALGADLSLAQLGKKFGEKVAKEVPLKSKKDREHNQDGQAAQPWDRVRVWEFWLKEEKQVFFFVEGYPSVLSPVGVAVEANGGQADPLGLANFFPCPKPLFANTTPSKLVPKPDRELAKDLYDEINRLSTRITLLEDAIRVVGVYDKSSAPLKRLLDEGNGNEMIPVDNWAMLAEKGGLRGAVDWFPVEQVVSALTVLRDYRTEQVDALRQITGMSDIMRGQASDGDSTATEQRIKARFGSVRMQKRQKELARFASDLQRLRAEVMAKHFDPSTFLARCNLDRGPDAKLAPQAVALIKSEFAQYRIEVKPEAVSMTDFDALKQERTEVIASISQFLTAAAPLAQAMPGSMPYLLEMLQWSVSGLRGASEIEGVLDQAIAAAKAQQEAAAANPQPPPPDPKLQVQQLKGQQDQAKAQADLVHEQAKLQTNLTTIAAETQAHAQQEQVQRVENTKEAMAKAAIQHAMKPKLPPPGGGGGTI